MKIMNSLKRHFVHVVTALTLFISVLAIGQLISCNKTNAPFGIYAPNGYDVSPGPGTFNVAVLDTAPVQGVTLYMLDPLGNTIGPVLSSQAYGIATFNIKNVTNGVWNAFLPTQGVSYVINGGAATIQHYYYNSYQPVTMLNINQASVSFYTNGTYAVTLLPVTQTFSYNSYPFSTSVTAGYVQSGNLNVPVSVNLGIESYSGLSVSPNSFILGEGVTQQSVVVSLDTCFAKGVAVTINANEFINSPIISALNSGSCAVTVSRNFSIPVTVQAVYDQTSNVYAINLIASRDCGVTFNYSVYSTHHNTTIQTGTIYYAQTISFGDSDSNDNVNFTISSPITPTYNCNMNLASINVNNFAVYCSNSF
jgi:hypothetical protein